LKSLLAALATAAKVEPSNGQWRPLSFLGALPHYRIHVFPTHVHANFLLCFYSLCHARRQGEVGRHASVVTGAVIDAADFVCASPCVDAPSFVFSSAEYILVAFNCDVPAAFAEVRSVRPSWVPRELGLSTGYQCCWLKPTPRVSSLFLFAQDEFQDRLPFRRGGLQGLQLPVVCPLRRPAPRW
jgi:hypothetical protein